MRPWPGTPHPPQQPTHWPPAHPVPPASAPYPAAHPNGADPNYPSPATDPDGHLPHAADQPDGPQANPSQPNGVQPSREARPWPVPESIRYPRPMSPPPPLPPLPSAQRSGYGASGRPNWIARPPAPVRPYRMARPTPAYSGPPAYPAPPRWGFPALAWRWPTALPGLGAKASPVAAAGHLARQLGGVLSGLAVVAGLAAAGEIWRYVLLVRSLFGALDEGEVVGSDLLVTTCSILALLGSALVLVLGVQWFLRARAAAADASGLRPSRPDWQVLVGTLVPGLNLAVPGSALAELEHTALGRPAADRPRPSRLLLAWWGCWAAGTVLSVITLLWYLRSSAQAMADGVLLHAVTDLTAVALCLLSVRLTRYLTALLAPVDLGHAHWERVVKVSGAPPLPLRRSRPADAAR